MTPDTSSYFIAAYVAAAVIYVGYGLLLLRRTRRVKRRLEQGSGERLG